MDKWALEEELYKSTISETNPIVTLTAELQYSILARYISTHVRIHNRDINGQEIFSTKRAITIKD